MAFVPGFEQDIFISYCHVDNLGADAWVTRFHENLEIALAQKIGRMGVVKIWRDKRLDGDQLFDETIATAIARSAIFVAITSNGYLASDYCRRELKVFHDKAAGETYGLQVGDRGRIYNVLLTGIAPARWPEEYGRISGFPFHDADDKPSAGDQEQGEPTDPLTDRARYKRQISALASALHRMLEAFRERAAQPAPAAAEPLPTTTSAAEVFIADVADPLASLRKRIVTELVRKGVSVEAGVPPPYASDAHAERVKTAAANALLSVHLLDEVPGREVDGLPGSTYPQQQLALARGRARSQFVWVRKELETKNIEDESYRAMLDALENEKREGASYDFVRGASSLLVAQIVEKLDTLRNKPAADTRGVLLDTHVKDQLYALELGKLLLARSVQPYINPQEDDPNKNLDAFEARLAHVSSLVILYGQVSEAWVRHRLGVALQMSVVKNLPIKAFYVLLVPPEKRDQGLDFRVGPVAVRLIDQSHSAVLDTSAVRPLCDG